LTENRESIGEFLYVVGYQAIGQKTKRWNVCSSKSDATLGTVKWFSRWRQYTFDPDLGTTFNSACLEDLVKFLTRVNDEHRAARRLARAGEC